MHGKGRKKETAFSDQTFGLSVRKSYLWEEKKRTYLWQWPLSDDVQGEWNTLFWNSEDVDAVYKK